MEFLKTLTSKIDSTELCDQAVTLDLPGLIINIRSNSQLFLEEVQSYFHSVIVESCPADVEVVAIQMTPFEDDSAAWEDWAREPGKTGRKDAFIDLPEEHNRLLYKVKTGMVFWQRPNLPAAFGDVEQHPNQIINFVLNQYLNHHLRENWVLGHAAGLQLFGKGMAVAGLSGGGKSTLMLHLLENGEHFISNDRLLFNEVDGRLQMRGIPKQPRINPGTIVHNPRLSSLIGEDESKRLLALPTEELRALEDKYDADIDTFYGEGYYQPETTLDGFIILNWSATTDQPTSLTTTTLNESPEMLAALIKSPGPFYSDGDGTFVENGEEPAEAPYFRMVGEVTCYVLGGKIDFDAAVKLLIEKLK